VVRVRQDDVGAATRPSVRSAVFAGTAVTVSLAGHVAAGGPPPDPFAVAVALAASAVAFWLVLAGRERSWPVLTVGLAATEALLHWLFMTGAVGSVTGAPAACPPAPGAGPMPFPMTMPMPMPMAVPGDPALAPGGWPAPGVSPGPVAGHGPGMLAGHLAASVVLAWFLRQGEAAVWAAARRHHAEIVRCRWARVLLGRWSRQVPIAPPAIRSRPVWTPPRVTGLGGRLVSGGRSWRGPPVPVA
jgi:hypothetical protein